MASVKVTVTLDKNILSKLDELVKEKIFKSRSMAVQKAIQDEVKFIKRKRFMEACKNLEPSEEISIAEEGMEYEKWPEY